MTCYASEKRTLPRLRQLRSEVAATPIPERINYFIMRRARYWPALILQANRRDGDGAARNRSTGSLGLVDRSGFGSGLDLINGERNASVPEVMIERHHRKYPRSPRL